MNKSYDSLKAVFSVLIYRQQMKIMLCFSSVTLFLCWSTFITHNFYKTCSFILVKGPKPKENSAYMLIYSIFYINSLFICMNVGCHFLDEI